MAWCGCPPAPGLPGPTSHFFLKLFLASSIGFLNKRGSRTRIGASWISFFFWQGSALALFFLLKKRASGQDKIKNKMGLPPPAPAPSHQNDPAQTQRWDSEMHVGEEEEEEGFK